MGCQLKDTEIGGTERTVATAGRVQQKGRLWAPDAGARSTLSHPGAWRQEGNTSPRGLTDTELTAMHSAGGGERIEEGGQVIMG